jgi:PPOX class probable F420-dependent enzyme
MDLSEALPLLTENHTAVATTVSAAGTPQSTIVTTGLVDGKLAWISRGRTIKVKNIERTGRATVTVIKLDTRRYVTVEGPAVIHPWDDANADAMVQKLRAAYIAMGRSADVERDGFEQRMADEKRTVIEVTPERVYGSLTTR